MKTESRKHPNYQRDFFNRHKESLKKLEKVAKKRLAELKQEK